MNAFYTDQVRTETSKSFAHYERVLRDYAADTPDHLKIAQARCLENLNCAMDMALKAAELQDTQTATLQLCFIADEWAAYMGYTDLLLKGELDPTDEKVKRDFYRNLRSMVGSRLTDLQNAATAAKRKETWDQTQFYREHSENLYTEYQHLIGQQRTTLGEAHQYNRHYMEAALSGAKQAQDGVRWMMEGVQYWSNQAANHAIWMQNGVYDMHSQMHRYSVEVMNAAKDSQKHYNEQMRQNLPREMEEAQERIMNRRLIRRGLVILAVIGGFLITIPLGYLYVKYILFPGH